MDQTAVNNQVIDGVVSATMLAAGPTPAVATAMLDLALVESVAAAMRNAVARQQQSSITNAAAATAICTRLLGLPIAGRDQSAMAPPFPPAPPPARSAADD